MVKVLYPYRKDDSDLSIGIQPSLPYLFQMLDLSILLNENQNQKETELERYQNHMEVFVPLLKEGKIQAMLYIGDCFAYGIDVEPNGEKAVEWYEKAAERGIFEAHIRLYELYRRGTCIPQDLKKAEYWKQKGLQLLAEKNKEYTAAANNQKTETETKAHETEETVIENTATHKKETEMINPDRQNLTL